MSEDVYAEIAQALRQDHVWVDDGLEAQVQPEEVAAMESSLEASGQDVYFVLLDPTDAQFAGARDVFARVHDASGLDGFFLGPASYTATPYSDDAVPLYRLEDATYGDDAPDLTFEVADVARELHPDDLGAGMVEIAQALERGDLAAVQARADEAAEERLADLRAEADGSGWQGLMGEPFLVGGGVLTLAVAVAVVVLRQRRRGASLAGGALRNAVTPASRRPYVLPASMIDRVREADAERLVSRARDEVLALGEHIDETPMSATAPTASWQAALDHYDAARRVLQTQAPRRRRLGPSLTDPDAGRPELLDVVGAIVLAARGEQALDSVTSGRSFVPRTPCFLNPLHGSGVHRRTLDDGDRRLVVPVCDACRRDLIAGTRPDILDVVQDGRAMHYFATDHEPWASTGFGALHEDLVERVLARR